MTLQGVPVIQRTLRPTIFDSIVWEPELTAASTTHELIQTIPAGFNKLLVKAANDGGQVPLSVVFDPNGAALDLEPISEVGELGNLRISGWYLDNPPVGPDKLIIITTATSVWHTARSWVEQNARAGAPAARAEAVTANGISTFCATLESEGELILGDAFSISSVMVIAQLGSGMLIKTNPRMTAGESAIVHAAYLTAYSDLTHNNNGEEFIGWTAPSAVNMVQLVINVLFSTGQVVTPPAETEVIAHWSLDETGTSFVDEKGTTDMVAVAGSLQPNDPLLADAGKSQKFLTASVRAAHHESRQVPTYWNTFFVQQTTAPTTNTHRTIANAANKPDDTTKIPGEWSLEPRNDEGTQRLRLWVRDLNGQAQFAGGLSAGVGTFSTNVGHRIDIFHDGTRAFLYLDKVLLGQTVPVPGAQAVTAPIALGDYGGVNFFTGLIDEVILRKGCPADKATALAGEPDAVTVTPPVEPSLIVMQPLAMGALTAGQSPTFAPQDYGTGFVEGQNIELVEVSDSANRLSVDGNLTTAPLLRATMPGTLPDGLASKSAIYQVRQAGGPLSNEWNISWQEQGAAVGDYTQFPFVVPASGRVQPDLDHTGVTRHGAFNAVNPKSTARICPMSGLAFWRITGDPGTPVKLFGTQNAPGNLIWSKYNTIENACSTGRNFNADASMTGFWEQKSVPGNPSGNLIQCAIIDITGEHGGQPWQLIRASGQPGFGEVKPVSTIWDPLDKYSMYEAKADGMYRWWPVGRPSGGNYPPPGTPGFERGTQARAVGAKVKLFSWPISGTTKQDQPRGGRMNLSNDGQWYFVPCKRTSDAKWGGYRCNVWTGQAGGPFVVNPDPGPDVNSTNNAIGKTSALGVLGSFSFQSIDGSKQDTNHVRFFNMATGAFLSEKKNVAGGHSHWFTLEGVDYYVGKVGDEGFGEAWGAYNPLNHTAYRVSDAGSGSQHLMGMNIHDRYETYPVSGGPASGQRYIFASTHASTGSPRDDGVMAFQFRLNNPNLKRYIVHTRGTRHEGSNNAEVHPQISHDSRRMCWNSNWRVPGVEPDGYLIHTYAMDIPDAFWSPNNDGS